jgi:glutaminase
LFSIQSLADNGVNPRTGEMLPGPAEVRNVLTLMMSCGMYDYAGEWSYEVGLPAKSGFSGGMLAILPGPLAMAVWSPPLDEIGNSVRGIAACRRISRDVWLHLFMNAVTVETIMRRETRACAQPSMRIRNPQERDLLATHGGQIGLMELQGTLYFASAERMIRQLQNTTATIRYLIFDLRRVQSIDAAAMRFFEDLLTLPAARGTDVAFANVHSAGTAAIPALSEPAARNSVRLFNNVDAAIEACEELLLEMVRDRFDNTCFGLDSIELFSGLDRQSVRRGDGDRADDPCRTQPADRDQGRLHRGPGRKAVIDDDRRAPRRIHRRAIAEICGAAAFKLRQFAGAGALKPEVIRAGSAADLLIDHGLRGRAVHDRAQSHLGRAAP